MKMQYYFLFIWLIIIIVIVLQNIQYNKNQNKEGFTPKIRGMYRPYVRHMRLNIESFANKYNTNYLVSFLRRIGLY